MFRRCVTTSAFATDSASWRRRRFKRSRYSVGIKEKEETLSPPFQHSALDDCFALVLCHSRGQEEPQFLGLHADGAVLEEISDYRNAPQQRHLVVLGGLRVDHDAAKHDGLAIAGEHLIIHRLSGMRGLAQNRRDTAIDLRV